MSKNAKLSPAESAKRGISNRILFSRIFGKLTTAAGITLGVIAGSTVVETGHGNNTAAYSCFGAVGLGFIERLLMYRKTNKTVTDFEQAEYDALPTETAVEVVDIFTRNVVAEAREVKPVAEPDRTPPETSPVGKVFIGTVAPFTTYIAAQHVYSAIFDTAANTSTRLSGSVLSGTVLALTAVCLKIGDEALSSHQQVCDGRIDAIAQAAGV